MSRSNIVAAVRLAVLAVAMLAGAANAQTFDDPKLGNAPCVVLNEFKVNRPAKRSDDPSRYSARAEVENICGRSLDLSMCFRYAEAVDGKEEGCYDHVLRPWDANRFVHPEIAVRITSPAYRWRYLPVEQ